MKQLAFKFLDSAGVPAEVFNSKMKKVAAPVMKRREATPYKQVTVLRPKDGFFPVLLNL